MMKIIAITKKTCFLILGAPSYYSIDGALNGDY